LSDEMSARPEARYRCERWSRSAPADATPRRPPSGHSSFFCYACVPNSCCCEVTHSPRLEEGSEQHAMSNGLSPCVSTSVCFAISRCHVFFYAIPRTSLTMEGARVCLRARFCVRRWEGARRPRQKVEVAAVRQELCAGTMYFPPAVLLWQAFLSFFVLGSSSSSSIHDAAFF